MIADVFLPLSKPQHKLPFVILCALFLWIPRLWADSESQRYLRNALHYYEFKNYARAREYFAAVLAEGTPRERRVARRYLALPEIKKAVRKHPPISKTERMHRLLSKGIELYEQRNYEDARPLLERVAQDGTPDQMAAAHSYLDKPEMEQGQAGLLSEPPGANLQAEAPAKAVESPVQINGFLSEQTAFRLSSPAILSLLRSTIYASGTGKLSDSLSYKVSGRLYYDGVYDLTHHYPEAVADDQKKDAELRDTYLDFSKGNWDARVGRQQIVWGEAIGAFVADVVNARDLRESILPSFNFIRIPQWGTDIEYSFEEFHAEGVWLPFLQFDKIPQPGAEFAPLLPSIPGYQVNLAAENTPMDSFENSEIGTRWSYRLAGWDASGFIFRTWDKAPVYAMDVAPGIITLTPIHPRMTLEGATVTKDFNGYLLKGEMVYYDGQYFSTTDPSVPEGLTRRDSIVYLAGVDHSFENDVDLGLQLSQSILRRYSADLINQEPVQTSLSAQINRSFLANHLTTGLEAITDFPHADYLLRPGVTYSWLSHWRWNVGIDLFGGSALGPFGQFSNHKRISSEIRYDF
uniref:Uncharacterized protein n=1 Tax=uncultured bacterium CSLF42 TaxID=1091574 RepID=G4WVX4_9BACT|nr:hypothetical protein [uncultured bacterium CSLF42]